MLYNKKSIINETYITCEPQVLLNGKINYMKKTENLWKGTREKIYKPEIETKKILSKTFQDTGIFSFSEGWASCLSSIDVIESDYVAGFWEIPRGRVVGELFFDCSIGFPIVLKPFSSPDFLQQQINLFFSLLKIGVRNPYINGFIAEFM